MVFSTDESLTPVRHGTDILHLRIFGIRQRAVRTGSTTRLFEQFLGILRRDRLAESLERILFVLPAIHVSKRRIGNRDAVGRIDGQQRLLVLRRQRLVRLDDERFVVHHGIVRIRVVDDHVLQPVGRAG